MASEAIETAFYQPGSASANPELLISAVLHLMSHFTVNSQESGDCAKLASVIERHLKALADLPTLGPVLQATCMQLSEQWNVIVERAMRTRQKQPKPLFPFRTSTRIN